MQKQAPAGEDFFHRRDAEVAQRFTEFSLRFLCESSAPLR
jgi:hypothetical protein